MTIEQIMAEIEQASRRFAAGRTCAESAANSLRALGRSAAIAGLCVLPSVARQYKQAHDEYEAKLRDERLEAHRRGEVT